ncbi:cupin domain-containing protein [Agrococcus sp. KRD186]|uniref:cupin domain-containing protein n=1 Tax=Agrococcus sp. KRD186 TaxID=2729730 RepID=UPI00314511AE
MTEHEMTDARPVRARELDLAPHPEGGWYRRVYTAAHGLETANGPRPAATLIHFFLQRHEHAAWHKVTSDEVWLWHGPGALDVHLGGTGERPATESVVRLDAPGTPGTAQQMLVPAGVWQQSVPAADAAVRPDGDVLVSCLVTPGFDFADWQLEAGAGHMA